MVRDWLAIMTSAHQAGLAKLALLEKAGLDLAAGRLDDALVAFEDSLSFFAGELERHFRHEEQALFPALARHIGRSGPIGAMVAEHESLCRSIDDLEAAVDEIRGDRRQANSATQREATRLAGHIAFLLRGHIAREDEMLFPLAQRELNVRDEEEVCRNVVLLDALVP